MATVDKKKVKRMLPALLTNGNVKDNEAEYQAHRRYVVKLENQGLVSRLIKLLEDAEKTEYSFRKKRK